MFSLLLLVVSHAIDKSHLQAAYFRGRSEQVGATGDLVKGEENIVLFGGKLQARESNKDISITDVGDTLAKSFWIGKLKKQSNPEAVTYQYDLPSANLLLTNFGLNSNLFTNLPEKDFLEEKTMEVGLDVDFYPADEVSIITSLLTGHSPQIHGVTSASWKESNGKTVNAFSSPSRSASKLSFFDLLKVQDSESELHIVGAATHETLAKAMTSGSYGASYFESPQSFTSDHPDLQFTWQNLLQSMTQDDVWKSQALRLENLDLKSSQVELFLMEMEYLNKVSKSFADHKSKLSVYSLATTTVEPLSDNEDVLAIFSHFLVNLVQKYEEAYPNGNYQVAFLETPDIETHEVLESKLSELDYHNRGLKHMNTMELTTICGTDGVVCVTENKDGTYYTTYQISVWVSFCASLAILAFSCNFCTLDFSQDAILYSTWVGEDEY